PWRWRGLRPQPHGGGVAPADRGAIVWRAVAFATIPRTVASCAALRAPRSARSRIMSATPPPERLSTTRALARLLTFARPVLPRLALGALSALGAAVVALLIPLTLEWVVAGPIASGATTA